MLVTRIVDAMPVPDAAERAAIQAGPVVMEAFDAAFARLDALHHIEVVPPPRPAPPRDSARILFWNAERLKYPAPSAALLGGLDADALLLCELDLGMARSGNRHTLADLGHALDAGWVFGTEFVELGLGDARERAWHASRSNEVGLHGAGILSRQPLRHPRLIRLERSGRWFDGRFGERRVGGRMALLAGIEIAGTEVLLVCVHYESHTGPADRLAQTEALLAALPDGPVLIGGDFNTSSFDRLGSRHAETVRAALEEDPLRLVEPQRHEPMFACLKAAGFDWTTCNLPRTATQRSRPDGTPAPPFGRLDWFFARGLNCSEPEIVPAVDAAGVAISDHEVLALTVRP